LSAFGFGERLLVVPENVPCFGESHVRKRRLRITLNCVFEEVSRTQAIELPQFFETIVVGAASGIAFRESCAKPCSIGGIDVPYF